MEKKNLKLTGFRSSNNKASDQTYFIQNIFKNHSKIHEVQKKYILIHNYIAYNIRIVKWYTSFPYMYDNYVNIQHYHVNIQHNYVNMQQSYVRMLDNLCMLSFMQCVQWRYSVTIAEKMNNPRKSQKKSFY